MSNIKLTDDLSYYLYTGNDLYSSARLHTMKVTKLRAQMMVLFLLSLFLTQNVLSPILARAPNEDSLPEINLSQTTDMKVAFLGISPEYVNVNEFVQSVSRNVSQFAYPNTMKWNLNISTLFHEFPENVLESLRQNAFHSEGVSYYNITLLDILLSQFESLAIPTRGYLTVFMWIPNNETNYSWFHVQERPDLFLGRIDYFNGVPFKYWAFPQGFGGMRRVLYFDMSDVMEETPIKSVVTNTVVDLFNKGLEDVFVDLLGAEDSRMMSADIQRYKNYNVRILWLNGTENTCKQLHSEQIKESFENLMPWTNWMTKIEIKAIDTPLNNLIENRTEELTEPSTYSFLLSNGTTIGIEARRNVKCDFLTNSGEHDPLIRFFFDHVEDYFGLTDLEDKSVIPVVFLQLRNDTTFGGAIQASVSWFVQNVIVVGFQGNIMTDIGESGPEFLTHLLRHEIGHWLSLSHHSSHYASRYPKTVCSMSSLTKEFCAFCKDARARMTFMSYYNATADLLSDDQEKIEVLRSELENALELFYDWEYINAVNSIISVYDQAKRQDSSWVLPVIICIILVASGLAIVSKRIMSSKNCEIHKTNSNSDFYDDHDQ